MTGLGNGGADRAIDASGVTLTPDVLGAVRPLRLRANSGHRPPPAGKLSLRTDELVAAISGRLRGVGNHVRSELGERGLQLLGGRTRSRPGEFPPTRRRRSDACGLEFQPKAVACCNERT